MNTASGRYTILFFIFIIAATTPCLFNFGGARRAFSYSGIPVKTAYIKKSGWTKYISVLGEAYSNGKAMLSAPFTGMLIESFPAPTHVSRGTVAARIVKPGLYEKIIAAKASAKYARLKLKRTRLLFHYGVAAKKDVEMAESAFISSVSALKALEAKNEEGVLKASFGGVLSYLVPGGTMVNAGNPVAVIEGGGVPYIKAYITPAEAAALDNGCAANNCKNQTVVIKTGGFKTAGKVFLVGEEARHFGLVAVYVKPEGKNLSSLLIPGEWVKLKIEESRGSGFSVPLKSVVILGGVKSIFVVKDGRAVAIPIEVITVRGGTAYIKGRVKGELEKITGKREPVVIYPVTRLVSGVSVKITR